VYIRSHRGFTVVIFLSSLPGFFRYSQENDFVLAPSGSLGFKGFASITLFLSTICKVLVQLIFS